MTVRTAIISLLAAAAFGSQAAADTATTGSCLSKAQSFKFVSTNPDVPNRMSVTLTTAFDEDSGQLVPSNHVYYLKATLSRGKAYTVWLEDNDGKTIDFGEIEPVSPSEESEQFEPGAMFAEVFGKWGARQYMAEDEWTIDDEDPEMSDPASWTYYFQLSGSRRETATFCYVQGVALPEGIEENPGKVSPTESAVRSAFSQPRLFVTNEFSYVFQADFKAGHRYLFVTEGGSENDPYALEYGGGKVTPYEPWQTAGNAARSFDPLQDGSGTFTVCHSTNGNPSATFNLRYSMLPQRTLAQHKPGTIEMGQAVQVAPRHVNDTQNQFYDDIIDGPLYGFHVDQGKRYLVETSGAQTNLLMRLYGRSGELLDENKGLGDGSGNVRCGFKASESGTYYVGVAVNLADDDADDPGETTAMLHLLPGESVKGSPDQWDDADDETSGATGLTAWPYGRDVWRSVMRGTNVVTLAIEPTEVDKEGSEGWHRLGGTDWYDTFVINVREEQTYRMRLLPKSSNEVFSAVSAEVFMMKGNSKSTVKTTGTLALPSGEITEKNGPLTFTPKYSGPLYVRLKVREGYGVVYPDYKLYTAVYESDLNGGTTLGRLQVDVQGPLDATWSIARETVKYAPGELTLPVGSYGVNFTKVDGFSTPDSQTGVSVTHAGLAECQAIYHDQSDPKDDEKKGATKWTVGSKETSQSRTLWAADPEDWFTFSGKDNAYFDFTFVQDGDQDAVFEILNEEEGVSLVYTNSVKRLELPSSKSKYYVVVRHADEKNPGDTSYVLRAIAAVVGDVKFAKTEVKAKDTATSVKLTVNRTAKDGIVRVLYSTVDGTARAGTNYVAQSGVLEWTDGDKKAKTVTVKLIPKLLAAYNGGDKAFSLKLEPAPLQEDGDYPASIPEATAEAVVTIQETSKSDVTAADVYAKKAPKRATVNTESGALRGGTFYGVMRMEDPSRANGLPELAAVTLTVSAKGGVSDVSKDSLTAKVALAGKNYTFKSARGEAWSETSPTQKVAKLELDAKVANVEYELSLDLSLFDGEINDESWTNALAVAKLTLSAGTQADVVYDGRLYRQNAKIQGYLDEVLTYAGYYTVSLANPNKDPEFAPAGHGYLTLTVDNKGKTKAAGLLADGTKISLSVAAAAVRVTNGVAELVVPVYASKSTYCFGGEIVLGQKKIVTPKPTGSMTNPDGTDYDIVVCASDGGLFWGNSNEKLTYHGTNGWALALSPVGGWYDTVFNLQNYYKAAAFQVSTCDLSEFPQEALADDYSYVTDENKTWQPNRYPVDVQGNALVVDKRKLVKDSDRNVDLVNSVNPYNVQLKYARATGIVTGSFSLWSESVLKQKEITGIKHYGIVLLERDASELLPQGVLSAGFFNQKVKLTDGTKRNWTVSRPFDIVEQAQDEEGDDDE